MIPSRNVLAQNLRILRATFDWTQMTLSEKSGVDTKYIVGIEAASRRPSLDTLDKLATAFGVSPYELLVPRDRIGR